VMADLRDALSDSLGTMPKLSVRQDPELLVGAVLRVGDRVFDASVAGNLEALRDRARELLRPEIADE